MSKETIIEKAAEKYLGDLENSILQGFEKVTDNGKDTIGEEDIKLKARQAKSQVVQRAFFDRTL